MADFPQYEPISSSGPSLAARSPASWSAIPSASGMKPIAWRAARRRCSSITAAA